MKIASLEKTDIPLYVQFEQILKSQIMMGALLPGEQLRSEKELAEIYDVSTITIRRPNG